MVPLRRAAIVVASIALATWPARAQDARGTSPAPEPLYALVTSSAKHVRADLTFEFVAPKVRAKEWIVYTTRLPELTSQTAVRSALAPGGHAARELERRGPARPVREGSGQGVQGARWTDGPGGIRSEPPRAPPCPAPARDQGRSPSRPTPAERATARARGRPSVRLPVLALSKLARRPQAPPRAAGGGNRLCPPSFPQDEERFPAAGPPRRAGPAGFPPLRVGQIG